MPVQKPGQTSGRPAFPVSHLLSGESESLVNLFYSEPVSLPTYPFREREGVGSANGAKGCLVNNLVGTYALWSFGKAASLDSYVPKLFCLGPYSPFDLRDIIGEPCSSP